MKVFNTTWKAGNENDINKTEKEVSKSYSDIENMDDIDLEKFLLDLFDIKPDWTEIIGENDCLFVDYWIADVIGHISVINNK